MTYLFSEEGKARMDEIVRPGMLCVFDFDGTLVPIVEQPDAARLAHDVLERLRELSDFAKVAILTGRALSDIRTRLPFEPTFVIGNHGMEGVPGWETRHDEHERVCAVWRDTLDAYLHTINHGESGIWVENKRYSLSVHYRAARDRHEAASRLTNLFEQLAPAPRIITGKAVFNLLPGDAVNKGIAMEQLMKISGAETAVYVGDDITDEDVFRVQRPDLLSVRVDFFDDSAAEFFVPSHDDITRLLDELILRLSICGSENFAHDDDLHHA